MNSKGTRTTMGLAGTGMSVTNYKSHNQAKPIARIDGDKKKLAAALARMTRDQKHAVISQTIMALKLDEVKAQQRAFEAQLVEHAVEIEETDLPDIQMMRQIYLDAIHAKGGKSIHRKGTLGVLLACAAAAFLFCVLIAVFGAINQ